MIRTLDHVPNAAGRPVVYGASCAGSARPDAYSLEQWECPRENQGEFGACGGHGSSVGLFMRYAILRRPLGWIPSPAIIYAAARAVTRAAFAAGQLDVLTDSGVQPHDMAIAISTIGICPMLEAQTADGRLSDVDVNTVNRELTVAEVEAAGRLIPQGMTPVDVSAPDFCEQLACWIAQDVPVGVGIWVDPDFQNYNGMAPLDAVDLTPGPSSGWHWVDVVAYRTDPKLGLVFKIVNSWGPTWGDGTGHVEITARRMTVATSDALAWSIS